MTVRLPRSGLGHALESYSRAYSYYARGEAEFIHPNWFKLRIGPYLRREADKRNYWRQIRTPDSWGLPYIHNFRRLFTRVTTEATFARDGEGQFLVVRDEGPHSFGRLQPYKEQLVAALESMSRFPVKPKGRSPSIGIFHRSGDFRGLQPNGEADERRRRTHGYGYIPPGYASDALRACRRIAGWVVPAVLSTDADAQEVACIIEQGQVMLSRSDSSFANLLEMRHHDVLIVETSSYGRWSFFLGNSFGVFPRTNQFECDQFHPLGITSREGAFFVFEHDTSLQQPAVAQRLARRLNRP